MLFHPRDQLPLRQPFRRRLSCIVLQVTEAQANPSVVMRQPGGCYRQLLQITTRIARRIPPASRFLRHVHMPVFPVGFQHQTSPLWLVTYLTWGQSGLSQLYSFTPSIRVPQASILVTASTPISRRPPASRKDGQHWL